MPVQGANFVDSAGKPKHSFQVSAKGSDFMFRYQRLCWCDYKGSIDADAGTVLRCWCRCLNFTSNSGVGAGADGGACSC